MKRDETLPILYRDDTLVAVDKPGGLLVHRSRESTDRVFLLQELREQLGVRLCHAWLLAFRHPYSGEELVVEAPLARELREFLERLPGFDPSYLPSGA